MLSSGFFGSFPFLLSEYERRLIAFRFQLQKQACYSIHLIKEKGYDREEIESMTLLNLLVL